MLPYGTFEWNFLMSVRVKTSSCNSIALNRNWWYRSVLSKCYERQTPIDARFTWSTAENYRGQNFGFHSPFRRPHSAITCQPIVFTVCLSPFAANAFREQCSFQSSNGEFMLCHDFFFAGDYAEDYSFSQDCGESPAIKVGITEGPLCEVAFFSFQ